MGITGYCHIIELFCLTLKKKTLPFVKHSTYSTCFKFSLIAFQDNEWSDVIRHPDTSKTGRYLVCPMCNERHEVPREGVTGYRKNFYVNNLKDGNTPKVSVSLNAS